MAQITSGIRAALSHAGLYDLSQNLLGARSARETLVREYFPDLHGRRMLDIGCGTAEILRHLPTDMEYVGYDLSEDYIRKARRNFGSRGRFHAKRLDDVSLNDEPSFDMVLAFGLLHHLEDDEARALFRLAAFALAPHGLLVTVDPAWAEGQAAFARWLIGKDRGRNVRDAAGYAHLAGEAFSDVRVDVRHDLLRVPYTHAILQCRKPRGA